MLRANAWAGLGLSAGRSPPGGVEEGDLLIAAAAAAAAASDAAPDPGANDTGNSASLMPRHEKGEGRSGFVDNEPRGWDVGCPRFARVG